MTNHTATNVRTDVYARGIPFPIPSSLRQTASPPLPYLRKRMGDIRANSIKRVASAVGEGSMAVQFMHQVLAGNY